MISYKILEILKNYYYFANENNVNIKTILPQPESFEVVDDYIVMTFTPSNFDLIKYSYNQDNLFNVRGFYLKNEILEFKKSGTDYQFTAKFKLPLNKKINDKIEIINCNPSSYNGIYKIVAISNITKEVELIRTTPNNDILQTLGYVSLEYYGGINKTTQFILDELNYKIKYLIDNQVYFPKQTSDLDLTKKPTIYKTNILLMNYKTFEQNNKVIKEYLLIDSTSFTIDVAKSPNNPTDSIVNIQNISQKSYDIYRGDIYYIINRNVDDEKNKTQSGGDIEVKQTEMLNILRGLLLNITDETRCYIISSTSDKDDIEGNVVLKYTIEFTKLIEIEKIYIPIDNKLYNIDKLQINTDTILLK